MIFYYKIDETLKTQFDNILNYINYENITKNKQLKVLLEILNNLNSIIQDSCYIEQSDKLILLLESLKKNLDKLRKNISMLDNLISSLNNLKPFFSNETVELNDTLISKIEQYNEQAINYKNTFQDNSSNFEDFIYEYINQSRQFLVINKSNKNESKNASEADFEFNPSLNNLFSDDIQFENNVSSVEQNTIKDNTLISASSKSNISKNISNNIENISTNSLSIEANNADIDSQPIPNTDLDINNKIEPHSDNLKTTDKLNITSNNKSFSIDNSSKNNSEDEKIKDNNTLLISEVQNKVILPYKVSDLEVLLKKSTKYTYISDIIENEYTFSMDKYKSATISRFKEAYNLMRKKEKSSVIDSLNLALELAFNYYLNPAIISACKSLDELDIYLDCLESNELEKFNIFEIKYEMLPHKK